MNNFLAKSLVLTASQVSLIIFSFLSVLILAKLLGVYNFGIYTLVISAIKLAVGFFEFGLFAALSRILLRNNAKHQELYGLILLLSLIISIAFVAAMFVVTKFLINPIYGKTVADILYFCVFFSFPFIFPTTMPFVFKASGKIGIYSLFNIGYNLIFMLYMLYGYFVHNSISVKSAIVMQSSSILFITLVSFLLLKPKFTHIFLNFALLKQEIKHYGWFDYKSRLYGGLSRDIISLIIGFLLDEKAVGLYRLAMNFAVTSVTASTAFAQILYKEFAQLKRISRQIFFYNLGLSTLSFSGVLLLAYLVIYYFMGADYAPVFPLISILLIGVLIFSIYQAYNEWMCANGYGKEILVCARAFFYTAIFSTLILTYYLHLLGAVIAADLAYLVYFVLLMYQYKIATNKNILST